jgi:rhodanese-related sulfurtransferase
MFSFLKRIFSKTPATDYAGLVKNGALIIDVRTPGEYKDGHIKGAVNIPLDEIRGRIEDIRKKGKPVITCCRSGARSGMARSILQSAGIECHNGGAWDSLRNRI